MALTLNVNTSIVDYLKSTGQDSSFGARKKLYGQLGLGDRLGDFVGSGNQNTALLNQLRSQGGQGANFGQPQPYQPPQRTTQTPYGVAQQSPYAPQSPYNPQSNQSPYTPSPTSSARQQREQFASFLSSIGADPSLASRISPDNFFVNQPQPNPTAPSAAVVPQEFSSRGFQFSTEAGEALRIGEGGTPELARNYQDVKIKSGDTLSKIAQQAGITLTELLKYNPGFTQYGRNPNLIFPGEIVKIPTARTDIPTTGGLTTRGGTTSYETSLTGPANAPTVPGEELTGTAASDVFDFLGVSSPSEKDVLNEVLNSPEYKLFEERENLQNKGLQAQADAAKQILETKYGQDKDTLEQNLASNGLAFSGIRTEQVKALSDGLAMSQLGVDRELAVALMESNLDLKGQFLKMAGQVVADAAQGRKEALAQLNAAGLAVIGNTLVPTLSARQQARLQAQYANDYELRLQQYDALQAQREVQNDLALQRLQISAQNAITSQERNAILNQMREIQLMGLTAVSPGQIVNRATGLPVKLNATQTEKFAAYDNTLNALIPKVEPLLGTVITGGATGNWIKFAANKPLIQQSLSAEQTSLFSLISELQNFRSFLQGGKQLTPTEIERLTLTLPDITLTNSQNRIRLQNFKELVEQYYSRELKLGGLMISKQTIPSGLVGEISISEDEFDPLDPLGFF